MTEQSNPTDLLKVTAEIVAAHVSHNAVAMDDLPQLIRQVYASLADVSDGAGAKTAERPDRKSTRLNSSHSRASRMPSSA